MTVDVREFSARTPLRVKLVAGVVLLAALGLTISGLAASTALRTYLLNRVDSQLIAALRDPGQLNALVDHGDSGGRGPRRPSAIGVAYVQFGTTASALPAGVSAPQVPPTARLDGRPFTVSATSGSARWRMVEGQARDRLTGTEGVLVVAVPLREVQQTVARLIKIDRRNDERHSFAKRRDTILADHGKGIDRPLA